MAYFAYKARNSSGALVEGVLETVDSGAAASQLFKMGVTPIEISAARASAKSGKSAGVSLFEPRIRDIDLMMFTRQMHTLLKAGVPIMRALSGLQESTPNKTFGSVIADLRNGLDSGRELSACLAQHPRVFSPFVIHMVRIGEMTGRLDEIFLRIFHHVEFEKMMREQVKTALRYPSFVIAAMAIALVVINLFVIPAFAKVYKSFSAKLPWMTQLLIDFSGFMQAYWPLMLLGLIGGVFAFRAWTRRPAGKLAWDTIKMRIPIAGKIVLKGTLSRFARSFALASRSGVPAVEALSIVAQTVDNAYVASKIEGMRAGVERGESLLQVAKAAGVFTPIVLQMLAVGIETGELDDLMQEIGELYQREVEYELKTLSSQIEPILILCLGGLVLVLALGVFLPIWDLGRTMIK